MLNVNWCRGCFKNAVSSWTVCLTAQHLAQQKESRTTTFSVYHCAISCRALSACVCIVHHHEPLQCSDQIWGILMASSPQMQDKAPVNRAKIQSLAPADNWVLHFYLQWRRKQWSIKYELLILISTPMPSTISETCFSKWILSIWIWSQILWIYLQHNVAVKWQKEC